VATETGHVKPEDRETAFNTLLETVEELVYEAEKFGVFVGIEGGGIDTISSPQWMYRLLSNIKSNNLQVVFDPFNFIPADDYHKQDNIIKQSFELFGDRIVAVHAKDFIIENGKPVPMNSIGKGLMNYELLLKLIKTRKPFVNVSMEGTRPETMEESKRFITELYEKI
jgi:L-ribulose-5-phosphate 3-epimerase